MGNAVESLRADYSAAAVALLGVAVLVVVTGLVLLGMAISWVGGWL